MEYFDFYHTPNKRDCSDWNLIMEIKVAPIVRKPIWFYFECFKSLYHSFFNKFYFNLFQLFIHFIFVFIIKISFERSRIKKGMLSHLVNIINLLLLDFEIINT